MYALDFAARPGRGHLSVRSVFAPAGYGDALSLRLERHAENTKKVVEFLKNHPKVQKVNHPSLPDHPDHALYERHFPNGGASIYVRDQGRAVAAFRFIDHLKIFSLLANVADVKSLVIHPATTTHAQLTEEELLDQGITPSTIRLPSARSTSTIFLPTSKKGLRCRLKLAVARAL